jgi:solute carrier family 10 (sodium/bile acid cotransporter), member 7
VPGRAFLERFWFLIALLSLIPLSIVWPEGGTVVREAPGVLPTLVALTIFLSAFGLDLSHLGRQLTQGRAIGLALAATYVVAPTIAWLLASALAPATEPDARFFLEGVMIAAAQASTLASAQAMTIVAGGDTGLALVLTIVSNVVTVVATPSLLEATLGVSVSFPTREMIEQMAYVVLGPVVAGQLARPLLWKASLRIRPVLRFVPQLIILVFVYTGIAAAGERLTASPDLVFRFLAVAAVIHGALLAFTWAGSTLLGLRPPARVAVVLSGSQKTLPNGIYLWDRFFSGNPHGALALVVLHVLQLVVDALIVPWLRPRDRDRS